MNRSGYIFGHSTDKRLEWGSVIKACAFGNRVVPSKKEPED